MAERPLIAILRGLTPEEAPAIGDALVEAGIPILEVPLNSPRPYESIRLLAERHGARALVGAGTVLEPEEARAVAEAGGALAVAPETHPAMMAAAIDAGLAVIPGFATPSEAFGALRYGAHALKFFPADAYGPGALKALRAVLPPEVTVVPTGGVTTETLATWHAAGASGFGIGTALYKPGVEAPELRRRAEAFLAEWEAVRASP
jgi:2-dehydro-3-deoxyphosphogalactonate aldolase